MNSIEETIKYQKSKELSNNLRTGPLATFDEVGMLVSKPEWGELMSEAVALIDEEKWHRPFLRSISKAEVARIPIRKDGVGIGVKNVGYGSGPVRVFDEDGTAVWVSFSSIDCIKYRYGLFRNWVYRDSEQQERERQVIDTYNNCVEALGKCRIPHAEREYCIVSVTMFEYDWELFRFYLFRDGVFALPDPRYDPSRYGSDYLRSREIIAAMDRVSSPSNFLAAVVRNVNDGTRFFCRRDTADYTYTGYIFEDVMHNKM